MGVRDILTALGDETRQQILITLLENEKVGMRVPEIKESVHLSRPAVSHHLQILKKSGLVSVHKVGTMNFYYIDAKLGNWTLVNNLVAHINRVLEKAHDAQYPRLTEDEEPKPEN